MNDLVNPNGGGLPGLPADFAEQLVRGIAESRSTTILGSGQPLLRLLKSGEFVFGQDNIEVQQGSHWLVNTVTLAHGWSCWVDAGNKNELRGDVMTSMLRDKPPQPAPIDGTPFKEQRSFELKCLDGEDAGTSVLYKNTSDGGMKAVDALLLAIQQQASIKGNVYLFPIITLQQTSYQHPKWGLTYKPVFQIQGWADMNGNREVGTPVAAPDPEVAPASEPVKPARARKAPLGAAAEPASAPAAAPGPVPTQQAHVGQRRRPVAR